MDKKEKNGKKNRMMQYGVLIVALIMIVSSGVYATIYITSDGIYDSEYNDQYITNEMADWIVWTDGSNYYAKNGTNGKITFSDNNYNGGFDDVIQDCIDELPGKGGLIYIKSGTYFMDDTIELYRDYGPSWTTIKLQGAGMAVTNIRLVEGSECNMINFTIRGDSNDGFKHLVGFTLQGSTLDTTGHGFYCKEISGIGGMYDIVIDDVEFIGMAEDGCHIENGWGVKITNSISETNNGKGFHMSGNQLYLANTFISYNGDDGIYATGNYHEYETLVLMRNGECGIDSASLQNSNFANINIINWSAAPCAGLRLEGDDNTLCNVVIDGLELSNADYGVYLWNGADYNCFYGLRIIGTDVSDIKVSVSSDNNKFYGVFDSDKIACDQDLNSFNGLAYNYTAWSGQDGCDGQIVYHKDDSKIYIYANNTWNQIS